MGLSVGGYLFLGSKEQISKLLVLLHVNVSILEPAAFASVAFFLIFLSFLALKSLFFSTYKCVWLWTMP